MRNSEMLRRLAARKAREAKREAVRSFKLWGGVPSRSHLSQGLSELVSDDVELDRGPICGSMRATPVPEDRLANLYGVPYEAQQNLWEMQREVIQEERADDRAPWQKLARYGADRLVMRSGDVVTSYRSWDHAGRKPPEKVEIPEWWRLGYRPEVVKGYRSHHRTAA